MRQLPLALVWVWFLLLLLKRQMFLTIVEIVQGYRVNVFLETVVEILSVR